MSTFRSAEIWNGKEWQPVEFEQLCKGLTFRLLDNGKVVEDAGGETVFRAASDPRPTDDGVDGNWIITVDAAEPLWLIEHGHANAH